MVFQDLRLFPHLTAHENLQLIPEVNKTAPSIDEMAKRLKVENCLKQLVSTLSHGQRQRVAIIRALQNPFAFLCLTNLSVIWMRKSNLLLPIDPRSG